MKILAALTTLLLVTPNMANAICVQSSDHTIDDEAKDAKIIFVATITEAHITRGTDGLPKLDQRGPKRAYYTVQYTFDVSIPIKGDPSAIAFLVTGGLWQDPKQLNFRRPAEQSKFVPGDNVLVIANGPGEAPISEIGCTPSMPWNREAYDLLIRTHLLPPDNSFKSNPPSSTGNMAG